MEQKHYLYSSGEFAKRAGVNKRTLHYYNDIGLFCPEVIEENGYHYYTCFQFAQLEMILTLRKIGLSIEEIREYASSPSDDSFSRIMEKRKLWIEESIQQLLSEQSFLEQKAERLKIAMNAKHGSIQLCSLPQQKILISSAITGKYDEADFSVAADFSLRLNFIFMTASEAVFLWILSEESILTATVPFLLTALIPPRHTTKYCRREPICAPSVLGHGISFLRYTGQSFPMPKSIICFLPAMPMKRG